ncbi:amidohydrolase family protein [Actinophytocola sediminis]
MDTIKLAHHSRRRVLGVAGLAAVGGVAGLGWSALAAGRDEPVLALTHVTVIDMTGAPPRPDQTVLVAGERITALGHSVPVPRHARVVDLSGKYLIPGLCDMHVHSVHPEGVLPQLYVAMGITTVREMTEFPWVRDWRDRVTAGTLLGPRWILGSRILDGSPSIWTGNELGVHLEVTTPAQARTAVRQAKREGADFVKVYSRLDRDSLLAIAGEADRQGIPFAGHAADAVPLLDAAQAGQRSVEHFFPALLGASSQEAMVRRLLADIRLTGTGDGSREWFRAIHPIDWLATTTHDAHRAADVYAQLGATRTAITPTLLVHHVTDRPEQVNIDPDRLRYLPPGTLENWRTQLAATFTAGRTPEDVAQHRVVLEHRLRMLGDLHAAGVPVLAGTDAAGIPFGYPGFGLHDELALLVRAGLSPMAALQAATREPAKFVGQADALGTIRPGHLADLVVLDANPLTDIHNTLRIHSVLAGGRYLDPAARQRLLADIEAAARAAPVTPTAGCC